MKRKQENAEILTHVLEKNYPLVDSELKIWIFLSLLDQFYHTLIFIFPTSTVPEQRSKLQGQKAATAKLEYKQKCKSYEQRRIIPITKTIFFNLSDHMFLKSQNLSKIYSEVKSFHSPLLFSC